MRFLSWGRAIRHSSVMRFDASCFYARLRCPMRRKTYKLSEFEQVKSKELFKIDSELTIPRFLESNNYVPEIDNDYVFDNDTTTAILLGLKFNKRVFIQGLHGTGKSTHIEQVCSRLNWPCIRINLDSHISRIDLLGKDSIILKDGRC